ncbi:thioredoxin family protein [Synoicihabitans lomoniglobus]|uniref:Thioredoxin family protein n=1 Tax=Synoicihabitans lomoniglobus TaxID=2909285 RepID=A0AAF0CML7_9BACT|nr:thioredoxin family protein [Opitutaceae bacterium LMO-M01]WED63215.1 thioredoxin family protein [Opitutaceae bacterium LMO-M01]
MIHRLLLLNTVLAIGLTAAEYPKMGPDIYDTTADAQVDIAAALTTARAEGKHVMLDFGANWCVWCHRLHQLFTKDDTVATALDQNFVVVMVDVNKRNGPARNAATVARYNDPTQHGLPVLVVLDADGKILTTQETGALEAGPAHDPTKVMAFLRQWGPGR